MPDRGLVRKRRKLDKKLGMERPSSRDSVVSKSERRVLLEGLNQNGDLLQRELIRGIPIMGTVL